jgi:hypothetical protein
MTSSRPSLPTANRPAKGGARTAAFVVGALMLFTLGGWFVLSQLPGSNRFAQGVANSPIGEAVKKNILASEEERMAYVEKFVRIDALEFAGDSKSDGDGGALRVGGLMRVKGRVANTGEQPVTPVKLVLTTFGETNEVLGTYVEDLTGNKQLAAGQTREFSFVIPEKKGFAGRYTHKLR